MTGYAPNPPNQLCAQWSPIRSVRRRRSMHSQSTRRVYLGVSNFSSHWRMINLITDHGAEEEASATLWHGPPGSTRRSLKLFSVAQPGYHNLEKEKRKQVWSVLLCLLLTLPVAFLQSPKPHWLPEVSRLDNFPRARNLLVLGESFFSPSLHRGPVS